MEVNDVEDIPYQKGSISFFTSFWGFTGTCLVVNGGESLNKSSIPIADWVLLSAAFGVLVFSVVEAFPEAVNYHVSKSTAIIKILQP